MLGGITPAGAGTTAYEIAEDIGSRDHPRWRGNDTVCLIAGLMSLGSPPLARERRILHTTKIRQEGITPAGAGTTVISVSCVSLSQDHPRWRGKDVLDCCLEDLKVGSPPLTRERQ